MFFKKRRRSKKPSLHLFSSLGLFFVIMAVFACVPLMATLVGVLIKGIIELQYVILAGGAVALFALLVWAVRRATAFFRAFHGHADESGRLFKKRMADGEAVELSLFGGMCKIAYKGKDTTGNRVESAALADAAPRLPETSAPEMPAPEASAVDDAAVVDRLAQLSALKHRGDIDAADYEVMKKRLIGKNLEF